MEPGILSGERLVRCANYGANPRKVLKGLA